MKILKYMGLITMLLAINLLISFCASAHLMVAQKGTINIVDDEAFVVVSLPISAFVGIDTNLDGQISMIEFNLNRKAVKQEIEQKFILLDNYKSTTLIDVLLSPVQNHHSTDDHFTQLTVMGKFNLKNLTDSFKLKADLFGNTVDEQVLKITLIRAKDNLKQVIQLTPDSPSEKLMLTHLKHE